MQSPLVAVCSLVSWDLGFISTSLDLKWKDITELSLGKQRLQMDFFVSVPLGKKRVVSQEAATQTWEISGSLASVLSRSEHPSLWRQSAFLDS